MTFSTSPASALYLLLSCLFIFSEARVSNSSSLQSGCFDWSSITPSENLTFHECYDHSPHDVVPHLAPQRYGCARLLLPLDWADPSSGEKVAIAIIRASSGLTDGYPQFGGHLIVNPGGPGESGVEFVRGRYNLLQNRINGGDKTFDIYSFDPRGVLYSTPAARCFSNETTASIWSARQFEIGSLDSRGNRRKYWDFMKDYLQECEKESKKSNSKIWNFMGADSVARDMLAIVDKLDHLTKLEDSKQDRCAPKKAVPLPSAGKLQYVGFSYGTYLGDVFASMFPDRVHRMILDGNINADLWRGNGYSSSLTFAEGVYEQFLKDCQNYSTCPLQKVFFVQPHHFLSWIELKFHIQSLIKSWDLVPFQVSLDGGLQQINGRALKQLLGDACRLPWEKWAKLANFLSDVFQAKVPDMDPLASNGPDLSCLHLNGGPIDSYYWDMDVLASVMCSDSEKRNDGDFAAFEEYYQSVRKESATFGEFMGAYEIPCRLWPESMRAKSRFLAPFITKNSSDYPILFVNNEWDPLTPKTNMDWMTQSDFGLENSWALPVSQIGHCALAQPISPDNCLNCWVHRYLESGPTSVGLLPPDHACKGLPSPFDKAFYGLDNPFDQHWRSLPHEPCTF